MDEIPIEICQYIFSFCGSIVCFVCRKWNQMYSIENKRPILINDTNNNLLEWLYKNYGSCKLTNELFFYNKPLARAQCISCQPMNHIQHYFVFKKLMSKRKKWRSKKLTKTAIKLKNLDLVIWLYDNDCPCKPKYFYLADRELQDHATFEWQMNVPWYWDKW